MTRDLFRVAGPLLKILLLSCCYHDRKKPTTLWVQNFEFEPLPVCGSHPSARCEQLEREGEHSARLGGDQSFSMHEKWHVPAKLCVSILESMAASRAAACAQLLPHDRYNPSWYLSLFAGAGSFDNPCRQLGLIHVSVSFDKPTSKVSSDCLHLNKNLDRLNLLELLQQIWHVFGLHASKLLGIGAHPPCEVRVLLVIDMENSQ